MCLCHAVIASVRLSVSVSGDRVAARVDHLLPATRKGDKNLPPNTLKALIEFSIFGREIGVIRLIRNGAVRGLRSGAGAETELIWIPSLLPNRSPIQNVMTAWF